MNDVCVGTKIGRALFLAIRKIPKKLSVKIRLRKRKKPCKKTYRTLDDLTIIMFRGLKIGFIPDFILSN